ncbi:hypothetical protein [Streptomyces sp. NPDC001020]
MTTGVHDQGGSPDRRGTTRVQVLASAQDFYIESYASLGMQARLLPPRGEFFGGFGRLLTARALNLVELRTQLPDESVSP